MTIEVLYTIMFFILGTVMGSFYNVVGYRLPKGMSLITPASHCPNCNHRLGPMELIPIVSYIIQLGKCKNCHQKISMFYPIFESLTGALFAISYMTFGSTPELLVALTFSSTLLIVILTDIRYMIICDELLIFSGIMLVILRLLAEYDIVTLLLDISLPFIFLLVVKLFGDFLFKKESLGGGDIKLMTIIGIALGWQTTIISVALAAFIALPISLFILIFKKTNIIAFGPFLSIAALIMYYLGINYMVIYNILVAI